LPERARYLHLPLPGVARTLTNLLAR